MQILHAFEGKMEIDVLPGQPGRSALEGDDSVSKENLWPSTAYGMAAYVFPDQRFQILQVSGSCRQSRPKEQDM